MIHSRSRAARRLRPSTTTSCSPTTVRTRRGRCLRSRRTTAASPRKDKRYLEEPGPAHYGMKPGMPLRRHTKPEVAYTKYTLDPAPLMVPAVPSVPAPPRPSVLLPMQDIEQIKSEFYTAGRADGRAAERVESRLAEDAVMAAGYKSRPLSPIAARRRAGAASAGSTPTTSSSTWMKTSSVSGWTTSGGMRTNRTSTTHAAVVGTKKPLFSMTETEIPSRGSG